VVDGQLQHGKIDVKDYEANAECEGWQAHSLWKECPSVEVGKARLLGQGRHDHGPKSNFMYRQRVNAQDQANGPI